LPEPSAEVRHLIARATAPEIGEEERRQAFDTLVGRFQPVAFGWALTMLKDARRAEDATQDAFVLAWRKLSELRDQAAFCGWLRQIVVNRCRELTRGREVETVPLETVAEAAAAQADPHGLAERRALREQVRRAIRALPGKGREVTSLFYLEECLCLRP
jgi:RNA polymerase sigma factor (sigma-70 family)